MSGILQTLFLGAAAAVKDAYFNLVTLLLNTTATNGAQNNTFLDSSSNNFTITRNGNTTQGTFTPFSQTGWGNYLQGSSSGFSFTGISIGTSQFTFEGWIYVPSFGSIQHMYGGTSTSGDISIEITNATTIIVDCSFVGNQQFTVSTMSTNAWHHIAVVRNASVATVFVDGVRSSTGAVSNTTNYTNFSYIGYKSSGFALTGYVSNFRVVKAAVYDPTQTTITVPTTPLTSIANTVLLTCQSNRFVDNGPNAVALTATNSPSVQAFSPFAPTIAYSTNVVGGSGYFDGSGDSLSATGSSLNPNGTDYTVEFWAYSTSTAASQTVFESGTSGNGRLQIYIDNATLYFGLVGTGVTGVTIPKNEWAYIACVKSGTTHYVYVNGTRNTAGTGLSANSQTTVVIGASYVGYFSGFRISNTAVYTGTTMTVPTSVNTTAANTQLLLSATNAGIYDSAAKNDLETVGNAQVSTTQAKWGTTSMYFDGTGDSLKGKLNNAIGGGDYTIEGWLYTGASGARYIFDMRETSQYLGAFTVGTTLYVNIGTTLDISATTSYPQNTWVHFAMVRSGSGTNNTSVFLNGSRVYQRTDTTNYSIVPNIFIGCENSGNYYLNGYIDEFRITKGYARYSGSTYTVPAAAFPIQ